MVESVTKIRFCTIYPAVFRVDGCLHGTSKEDRRRQNCCESLQQVTFADFVVSNALVGGFVLSVEGVRKFLPTCFTMCLIVLG